MTKIFLICLVSMAYGAVAGYIAHAASKRQYKRDIEALGKRIEGLYGMADTWRKVANDRLEGRRPAA
jgi:hypothetical protein